MAPTVETIAAIATPPGKGGVGIVRVSGPLVKHIEKQLCSQDLTPRLATYTDFLDCNHAVIDQGVAILFVNPHSFTGEDVLELQGHGGPVVMQALLQAVLAAGARLARPGEFSERAFLNNKMDLVQAEAVADLIDAQSTAAARSAVASLQGEFSRQIQRFNSKLIELRQFVEAAIDFPDEDIEFINDSNVVADLEQLIEQLQVIQNAATQGRLLQQGINVVITGKPNAGKSSLLNQLCGVDSAIVTPIAGTTRDVLREHIHLDGLPIHLIDTAGLRATEDVIEKIGVERAQQALQTADVILAVIDISRTEDAQFKAEVQAQYPDTPIIWVYNKIDLTTSTAKADKAMECSISAKHGDGVSDLKQKLKQLIGYHAHEAVFIARQRHVDALTVAAKYLQQGLVQLHSAQASELLAEDLRQAQLALNTITGEFTSDDLLGVIFSSFCIGK